jgi:hypothetical protein
LRTGKIVKPAQCSICKALVGVEHIQAHHEDYSRPLEVVWCCHDCHVQLDRRRREEAV